MPDLSVKTLLAAFGHQSELARQIISALHAEPPPAAWQPPPALDLKALAKPHTIADPQPHLLYVLQLYYATVIKCLAATQIGTPTDFTAVENGTYFQQRGIRNLIDDAHPVPRWLTPHIDPLPILQHAASFSADPATTPPDVLKALYHDLFPRKIRHALGEYYTPDWLAGLLLDRLGYTGAGTLLDPACGSGTFLVLALRRMPTPDLSQIAGIDINPLACLAARANLLLASGEPDDAEDAITLPVYCADSILHPPEIGLFDFIAGNPPWVNWETMDAAYRQQTRDLWLEYGLFPHSGLDSILGKGKKDLALLLTYTSIHHYLHDDGKIGFILTEAALKSSGAGEGFRLFKINDTPIRPLHIDDMARMRPFYGVSARTILLIMKKGHAPQYPVPYVVWRKKTDARSLRPADSLATINRKTTRVDFVAEPIDAPQSAWLSGKPAALHAVRKVIGKSDYTAHAGVYTGGANAVYWLRLLAANPADNHPAGMLRVQNIVAGAKRKVPQRETLIEDEFVFPFLQGRDVQRWQAIPSAHILVVQDPQTRRGYAEDWLQTRYPRTYAYLALFEDMLRTRAAYKRYFRDDDPFYSMFNVGDYTFAPYKIVWQGMGTNRIEAAVISDINSKPIMTNQAMHPFIGIDDLTEAHYLCALLNSAPFEYAVLSHTQPGGKSFAQPGILQTLRLPRYTGSIQQRTLAHLSQQAHADPAHPPQNDIDQTAAAIWGLSSQEHDEIRASLHELRRSR